MNPRDKYFFKLEGDIADPGYLKDVSGDNVHLSLALLVREYSKPLRDYLGAVARNGGPHLIYTGPFSPNRIPELLKLDDVLAISLIHQKDKLVGPIKIEFANVHLDLEQLTES